ncbi:MAG: hypothetical protein R3F49_07950 [Planctomycetota bacterium]
MLIPLALIACQFPQPSSVISLVGSQRDDDYAADMQFTPDGRRLLVHHRIAPALSAVTEIDVALGRAVARSPELQECNVITISPDGTIALAPERYSGRLRILSVPGLQLLATVNLSPFSGSDYFRSAVDSTSTRAVLMDGPNQQIWVIDLATATQQRLITLPVTAYVPEVHIGADDLSMAFRQGQSVYTIDISTGLESARTPISAPGTPGSPIWSDDGSVIAVMTETLANGAKYVERFTIPGLTSLGWVPLNGAVSQTSFSLDRDGDRGLVFNGTTSSVANLVTGTLTGPIPAAFHGSINGQASRVVASTGYDLVVVDAGTGATLGRFLPRGDDRSVNRIQLSPDGRFAAVGRQGSERIELFEITTSAPIRRADVSSGFGVEADGPYTIVVASDGREAAVVARDSDDLRVVEILGSPTVRGRVELDRGPEHAARRADGRVLVVHGRGASLSVVDLAGPTELVRFALPDPAYFVQPELQGTAAWVLLDGSTSRSLVRMDTATGAILAFVPLPGGAGLTSLGRELLATVEFDLPRGRAFVASPDTGQLSLIDLPSASLVTSVTVPTIMERAALAVSSDGTAVYHRGSLVDATAFAVSPQSLGSLWTWSCGTPPLLATNLATLALFDSDRYILCNGGCISPAVILSAATGSTVSSVSTVIAVQSIRAFDDEVWIDTFNAPIHRYRALAGALTSTGFEGDTKCCSELVFVASTGLAIGMADENGPASAPRDDHFFVLDLVQDTITCTPNVPNSTGAVASLRTDGRGFAGAPLIVTVERLQPGGMLGYLLAGSFATPPAPMGFGVGQLCLGGAIARFSQQVQLADSTGRQRFVVDTSSIPSASAPTAVLPGSTWIFQAWHRDTTPSGAVTSNTSIARSVRFD